MKGYPRSKRSSGKNSRYTSEVVELTLSAILDALLAEKETIGRISMLDTTYLNRLEELTSTLTKRTSNRSAQPVTDLDTETSTSTQ